MSILNDQCPLATVVLGSIYESDVMTVDRLNTAYTHVISWWRVWSIPEKAQHIRETSVTTFESHHHFVIFLGHEKRASIFAAHRGGNANPIGLVALFMRIEPDLDPAGDLLVNLSNSTGNDSLDQTHSFCTFFPVNSVV